MTAKRQAAPELYHRSPDCSVCGEEVNHDGDSFHCEHCNAYWPDPHGEGTWYNEDDPQCASTHQPMALNEYAKGKPYQYDIKRCLLDADHAGKHRSDMITNWTDESAVNGYGGAS